jgi:hypothetical protein
MVCVSCAQSNRPNQLEPPDRARRTRLELDRIIYISPLAPRFSRCHRRSTIWTYYRHRSSASPDAMMGSISCTSMNGRRGRCPISYHSCSSKSSVSYTFFLMVLILAAASWCCHVRSWRRHATWLAMRSWRR